MCNTANVCSFAEAEIDKALDDGERNLRDMQIQQEEFINTAKDSRKIFEESFYVKMAGFGWSQIKLYKSADWYHWFNVNNELEPRCVFADTSQVWYTTLSPRFEKPEDGPLTSIEDIKVILDPKDEKDHKITGPACKKI